jgi:hypothetical protein
MPRANRYCLAGHVWHLTERCHGKQFLLKFARDRRAWVRWLYVARRCFGLCVLNHQVTSNHVHLLVLDRGGGEIAHSMQLTVGCVGPCLQPSKAAPGGVLGRLLPRDRGGHRRTPGALLTSVLRDPTFPYAPHSSGKLTALGQKLALDSTKFRADSASWNGQTTSEGPAREPRPLALGDRDPYALQGVHATNPAN